MRSSSISPFISYTVLSEFIYTFRDVAVSRTFLGEIRICSSIDSHNRGDHLYIIIIHRRQFQGDLLIGEKRRLINGDSVVSGFITEIMLNFSPSMLKDERT